jgi:cytochrome c oxidase cbb3-type subunit 3/ubiquinol-cytochrome c reductase cytochrome c subunit
LLAAGCNWPGRPDRADQPVPDNQVVNFESLYRQHCAGCHGADGKVGPAPPLNDPLFRAGMPEMDLEMVIAAGRAGTPMPAFARKKGGPLTEVQIQVLLCELKGIRYKVVREGEWESVNITIERDVVVPVLAASTVGWIASPLGQGPLPAASAMFPGRTTFKGITPKWGAPGAYPKNAPPLQDDEDPPPRTKADFKRIRETVFAEACAGCHGDRGQGFEKGGQRKRAINDPAFLALVSDQALRRYVITGRPDLGMPSYAGARDWNPEFSPLDSQKVTELVALLAEWKRAGAASGK